MRPAARARRAHQGVRRRRRHDPAGGDRALHAYGVERIYSPDDGRAMGLQGMINDLLRRCDFAARAGTVAAHAARLAERAPDAVASLVDDRRDAPRGGRDDRRGVAAARRREARSRCSASPAPAAPGKSSLVDELVRRFLLDYPDAHARRPLRRSVEAQDRRRAARRPHPHERDRRPARVHALARDAPGEPRAVEARAAGDRRLQGRGVRPDHRRDQRHRPVRHRDRRPLRRVALRDDVGVRRGDAAREDRHARLRRRRRDQQVRQARLAGRAARRAQAGQARRAARSRRPTTRCRSTARSRRSSTTRG